MGEFGNESAENPSAISAGTVSAGLGGVNTTITMYKGNQPFHQKDGKCYIKPIHICWMGSRT